MLKLVGEKLKGMFVASHESTKILPLTSSRVHPIERGPTDAGYVRRLHNRDAGLHSVRKASPNLARELVCLAQGSRTLARQAPQFIAIVASLHLAVAIG